MALAERRPLTKITVRFRSALTRRGRIFRAVHRAMRAIMRDDTRPETFQTFVGFNIDGSGNSHPEKAGIPACNLRGDWTRIACVVVFQPGLQSGFTRMGCPVLFD